jgi:hypothetical protein
MGRGRPRAGGKPNWTACWRGAIGTGRIGGWPITCTNALSVHVCVRSGFSWRPPIIWRNARILLTARQQDQDVFELLTDLLRSPQPKLLDILPEVEVVTGARRVDAVARGGGQPEADRHGWAGGHGGLPGLADVSVWPGWLRQKLDRSSVRLEVGSAPMSILIPVT